MSGQVGEDKMLKVCADTSTKFLCNEKSSILRSSISENSSQIKLSFIQMVM